ncbi:hypothetical protein DEO72_LG3g1516 [Vigna unguiculata]|uniref:Secreted protein n=1 Tax=Vigna unguiculata TaxID=3917 RepID=A0A4D6LF66_VIGUN|nr:hypothetical protein DEO72_LG3g1516 [Vigna unguiculata]
MMVFFRVATCLIWFTATNSTSGFKSRFQTDSRVFFAVQLNCFKSRFQSHARVFFVVQLNCMYGYFQQL